MAESFDLNDDEKLKQENTFMKMKLMLEHGARFGPDNPDLPPEVENMFLQNILKFEERLLHKNQAKKVTVFERIGSPDHFKPVQEIQEVEIEREWERLQEWLLLNQMDLQVCSPRISPRELYRFTTEELFKEEMDDDLMPGFVNCYIYDEFHPDPVYESEKTLRDVFFPALFSKEPVGQYFFCVHDQHIRLNNQPVADVGQFKERLNRFKSFYDCLELTEISFELFHVDENQTVTVNGHYTAMARQTGVASMQVFKGNFRALMERDDVNYWAIREIHMEGINP